MLAFFVWSRVFGGHRDEGSRGSLASGNCGERAKETRSGTASLLCELMSVGNCVLHPTTTRAAQTAITHPRWRFMIAPLSATQEERTATINLRACPKSFWFYRIGSRFGATQT